MQEYFRCARLGWRDAINKDNVEPHLHTCEIQRSSLDAPIYFPPSCIQPGSHHPPSPSGSRLRPPPLGRSSIPPPRPPARTDARWPLGFLCARRLKIAYEVRLARGRARLVNALQHAVFRVTKTPKKSTASKYTVVRRSPLSYLSIYTIPGRRTVAYTVPRETRPPRHA